MVKSVKAIIIVSVMVSMSVMLINSCGVSSPTASTGNTGVVGLSAATGCVPSVPGAPDPSIYLPTGISSDAAKALLENPNANPNASGTSVPFDSLCGNYTWDYGDQMINQTYSQNGIIYYYVNRLDVIAVIHPVTLSWTSIRNKQQPGVWVPTANLIPYVITRWSVPCNLLPPNASVPPDMFAGKGYPDGDYVIGGDWFSLVGGKATWKGQVTPCTPDGARPKKLKTLTDLTIEPATLTVGVGQTASFSAIAHYSDGSTQDVTADAVTTWKPVTFLISMNLDATLPTGGTAIAANTTTTTVGLLGLSGLTNANTITTLIPNLNTALNLAIYTSQDTGNGNGTVSYNGLTRAFTMIVKNLGLKEIAVTPPTATIYIHENVNSALRTQQYKAMGKYYTAPDKDITTSASWNSSNNNVATIDTNGLATAGIMPGSVSVTTNIGLIISNKAELCVECRKYTRYSQVDPAWSGIRYNHIAKTIGQVGCAMTDMAMIIDSSSFAYSGVTPFTLNNWMNQNGGYTDPLNNSNLLMQIDAGGVLWNAPYSYTNGFILWTANHDGIYDSNTGARIPLSGPFNPPTMLDGYLMDCNAIIAKVKQPSGNFHWILITKKRSDGEYIYIDPLSPAALELPLTIYNSTIYAYKAYKML